MEAAYDVLLLLAALIGTTLILFVAWSIAVPGVRTVSRGRARVEQLRAQVALLEREVRNRVRGASSASRQARERLAGIRGTGS